MKSFSLRTIKKICDTVGTVTVHDEYLTEVLQAELRHTGHDNAYYLECYQIAKQLSPKNVLVVSPWRGCVAASIASGLDAADAWTSEVVMSGGCRIAEDQAQCVELAEMYPNLTLLDGTQCPLDAFPGKGLIDMLCFGPVPYSIATAWIETYKPYLAKRALIMWYGPTETVSRMIQSDNMLIQSRGPVGSAVHIKYEGV